jgi:predicted ABC-type ATPase
MNLIDVLIGKKVEGGDEWYWGDLDGSVDDAWARTVNARRGLESVASVIEGSETSGNYDHRGIIGHRGGSLPKGWTAQGGDQYSMTFAPKSGGTYNMLYNAAFYSAKIRNSYYNNVGKIEFTPKTKLADVSKAVKAEMERLSAVEKNKKPPTGTDKFPALGIEGNQLPGEIFEIKSIYDTKAFLNTDWVILADTKGNVYGGKQGEAYHSKIARVSGMDLDGGPHLYYNTNKYRGGGGEVTGSIFYTNARAKLESGGRSAYYEDYEVDAIDEIQNAISSLVKMGLPKGIKLNISRGNKDNYITVTEVFAPMTKERWGRILEEQSRRIMVSVLERFSAADGHVAGIPGHQGGSAPANQAANNAYRDEEIRQADYLTYLEAMKFETDSAKEMLARVGLTKEQAIEAINKARSQVEDETHTKDLYSVDGVYIPERQRIHDEIVASFVKASETPGQPTLFITGGLPGSGKSSMLKMPEYKGYKEKYNIIDSDEIKEILAKRDGLLGVGTKASIYHSESDDIANEIVRQTISNRHNIGIDATMKSVGKMERLIKELTGVGYRVEIAFADLPLGKAIERATGRFLGGGRFVDPLYIATHDHKNHESYDKLRPMADVAMRWDTDVPFGASPILIEGGKK